MYTYEIFDSENPVTYGTGFQSVRLEITNTLTGEKKVCDNFTYLEDGSQDELEMLFESNFDEEELW